MLNSIAFSGICLSSEFYLDGDFVFPIPSISDVFYVNRLPPNGVRINNSNIGRDSRYSLVASLCDEKSMRKEEYERK